MKQLDKLFDGHNIIMYEEEGKVYFEVESVSMAIGYVTKAKGKEYPHKTRIKRLIHGTNIDVFKINGIDCLDITGLRNFITLSHTENKQMFINWLKENNLIKNEEVFLTTRKENVFFKALSEVLKEMNLTLQRQVIEDDYRLDMYIKELDIVIEYDENSHSNYDKEKEFEREEYIKKKHSHLIRVTDFNSIYSNIGKIVFYISQLFGESIEK